MTHTKVVGLCLAAVFALGAVVASAAQAGEYGRCLKAAQVGKKYTGGFEDKNCQTVNPAGEGKYEWYSGLDRPLGGPLKPGYTSKTTKVVLASSYGRLECKTSKDVGEITGVKTDVDLITFTGCTMGGMKCNSEGQVAGTIKTNKLNTTLIDNGELGPGGAEPVVGEVWTEYAAAGGYIAEYECPSGPLFARVSGSVSGVNARDVNLASTTGKTRFEGGHGEQDLLTEVSSTGLSWEPAAPSVQTTESTIKTNEKWEIKAALPCEPYPACL